VGRDEVVPLLQSPGERVTAGRDGGGGGGGGADSTRTGTRPHAPTVPRTRDYCIRGRVCAGVLVGNCMSARTAARPGWGGARTPRRSPSGRAARAGRRGSGPSPPCTTPCWRSSSSAPDGPARRCPHTALRAGQARQASIATAHGHTHAERRHGTRSHTGTEPYSESPSSATIPGTASRGHGLNHKTRIANVHTRTRYRARTPSAGAGAGAQGQGVRTTASHGGGGSMERARREG
jgi:hypothetical protein